MTADHVSEDAARALLARAADTVDVDPSASLTLTGLPEPGRRRWPAVAAAAAAVALLVTGVVWINGRHDGVVDPSRPSGVPVERAHDYGPHRMPAVLGYTGAEAKRLLEQRGLQVRIDRENRRCALDDQVLSATPAPGEPIEAGATAELRVARATRSIDCHGEINWHVIMPLIRFALGRGPAPRFADKVVAQVVDADGHPVVSTTLTAKEAAQPDQWIACVAEACHSAIGGLAALITDRVGTLNGHAQIPFINATPRGVGSCPPERKAAAEEIWLETPTDGTFCANDTFAFDRDEQGRITRVVYTEPLYDQGPLTPRGQG